MPIVPVNNETLARAAAFIRAGGLVAFPTETVYGLGADAHNAAAVARVFEVKGRPRFDPLIVHIAAPDALETVADISQLEKAARDKLPLLAEHFWPGPLTLVLPRREDIPGIVSSGLPTVAVRVPRHPAAQQLIALSTGAVAAPSANPFGYISPTRAQHVGEMLGEKVDMILDGGPATVGVESTVLDMCGGQPRILRPGGTPQEAIEAVIGAVLLGDEQGADGRAIVSPGQLKSHYAPRTPLSALRREQLIARPAEAGAAFLFFDGAARSAWLGKQQGGSGIAAVQTRTLSETGDLLEAAARLFEVLHELDHSACGHIYAQLAPESGLGAAINDRLRRAAAGQGKQTTP